MQGYNKPRKGHDAGDHPPITPTRAASRDQLDGDAWRIYDYVTRHFIGTVSYNCKYTATTMHLRIGEENFSLTGKKLVDPGFTAVMTWQALGDDEEGGTGSVPKANKGDQLPVKEVPGFFSLPKEAFLIDVLFQRFDFLSAKRPLPTT